MGGEIRENILSDLQDTVNVTSQQNRITLSCHVSCFLAGQFNVIYSFLLLILFGETEIGLYIVASSFQSTKTLNKLVKCPPE